MSNHSEHHISFGTLTPEGTIINARLIKQSDLAQCPHLILAAEHYRPDGTCYCDDPHRTEMKDWGYRWNKTRKQWV